MRTFRFRDFVVYKDARAFRKLVKVHLQRFPNVERFRLVDQIHRSAISVLLNIAEGSAKKSDKDFAHFLETAIASLNEVIAGFDVALDDGLITEQQQMLIENDGEKIAKQIGSFIRCLRPSLRQKPIANC